MDEVKAKYTIITTFGDFEVPIVDYVFVKNKFDNVLYVNFLTVDGQLGKIKEENVGIVFITEPTKEDVEDFVRLKKESEELQKKVMGKKEVNDGIYS